MGEGHTAGHDGGTGANRARAREHASFPARAAAGEQRGGPAGRHWRVPALRAAAGRSTPGGRRRAGGPASKRDGRPSIHRPAALGAPRYDVVGRGVGDELECLPQERRRPALRLLVRHCWRRAAEARGPRETEGGRSCRTWCVCWGVSVTGPGAVTAQTPPGRGGVERREIGGGGCPRGRGETRV